MSTSLSPYLSLTGNAREALEFYRTVFGGEVNISTFGEAGMDGVPAEGVMHGELRADDIDLMASDRPGSMPVSPGDSVTLALTGTDSEKLHTYWDRLADGATIGEPLAKAPWGDEYGQLVDRFGFAWMVDIYEDDEGEDTAEIADED